MQANRRSVTSQPVTMRRTSSLPTLCVAAVVVAVSIVLGSIATRAQAQSRFEAVEIEASDLGSGVFMLTGAGGNIGVCVGPDGVLLVDDQFAPLTEKIHAAIRGLSPESPEIRFVLNTHWHGDHTGGNENLGSARIPIVAHERVRARMSTEHRNPAREQVVPASPRAALPIVTFAEGITFHLNGQTIDVHHVAPAHTDGDSIVHFREADVLHLGDTYFAGMFPYIDRSSGGHIDGVIAAQGRALELAGPRTQIIPGHGPVSSAADLRRTREALLIIRERVHKMMTEGRSRAEILASPATEALEAIAKPGFVGPADLLGFVYDSLSEP